MSTQILERPKWTIDEVLNRLVGQNVRVAARACGPLPRNGRSLAGLQPTRSLYLPDNSQAGGLTVFFEGRLVGFQRKIGVVIAELDSPALADGSAEGTAVFRGKLAVILHGPALVQLDFPFRVERLPGDAADYWRDLRSPVAQLEFPFSCGH